MNNNTTVEPYLFHFPDRDIVNSWEWQELSRMVDMYDDFYNDVFSIHPYSYSEDEDIDENLGEKGIPNFQYKPTNFKIWWYKYPFRCTDMNQNLTKQEICKIFEACVNSLEIK